MNDEEMLGNVKKAFDLIGECIELNNLQTVDATHAMACMLGAFCLYKEYNIERFITGIGLNIRVSYEDFKKQKEERKNES